MHKTSKNKPKRTTGYDSYPTMRWCSL